MPRAPTADIPHLAFTHHRIGIHDESDPPSNPVSILRELRPTLDLSHLAEIDRDRCLGIAYLELSDHPYSRERGQRLLEGVLSQGLSDGEIEAGLALCYRRGDPIRAIRYATSALARDDLAANTRVNVLWLAGSASFDLGQFDQAIEFLEELRTVHRSAETFLLLDACYERQGRFDDALDAARQAVKISPWRADLQSRLAKHYTRTGKTKLAAEHSRRGEILRDLPPP